MATYRHARYHPILDVGEIVEAQFPYDSVADQPGRVYVCPECGDTWGKITLYQLHIGRDDPERTRYIAVNKACATHGDGSVIDSYTHVGVPRLEFQATLREMELAIMRAVKKDEPQ